MSRVLSVRLFQLNLLFYYEMLHKKLRAEKKLFICLLIKPMLGMRKKRKIVYTKEENCKLLQSLTFKLAFKTREDCFWSFAMLQ
jgi:hypothetical protein